jgi:hypothetical protein
VCVCVCLFTYTATTLQKKKGRFPKNDATPNDVTLHNVHVRHNDTRTLKWTYMSGCSVYVRVGAFETRPSAAGHCRRTNRN